MEENSSAVECLLLFYINMKQVLKTKQLIERVFIDQMIKYCKENEFTEYSNEEIKNTWKNLVSRYLSLKTKNTIKEKETWKYYEILDSCYEHSDFHNGVYPKFSEEMVWFLIECFLKRKALKKSHKQSSIISEIHKEFLNHGYLYITKQDIENKWRHLNLKYEKSKHDPERLKKWPYLQALIGFHEPDARHIVNMAFTRELTEILIERFTEKKIACVIHGYNSEQVLSEIQTEFKDLGFYFSKEDIKEKWRKLTNVYKFLIIKRKTDTSWVYFKAMQNHFKDDFSFPWGRMSQGINEIKQNDGSSRRLRQRSKSVGPELMRKKLVESDLVVELDKVVPSYKPKLKDEEKVSQRKRKISKRSRSEYKRSRPRKKLKLRESLKVNKQKLRSCKATGKCENETLVEKTIPPETNSDKKLSVDRTEERRNSECATSKVHIINIDHSNIDQSSGNLTINLPSITKQFSDNEFLPLKKRLRLDGDNIEKESEASKEIKDGFLGFPPTQKLLDASRDKRLSESEMLEIMERIDKENSINETKSKSNDEMPCKSEDLNYQNVYRDFNQSCLIVPKEEKREDNLTIQNYNAPSTVNQPPMLLLVIKVDGSNNTQRENVPNQVNLTDRTTNPVIEIPSNNNVRSDITHKQEMSPSTTHLQVSKDLNVKPISPKGKMIILSKNQNLVPLEVDCRKTSEHNINHQAVVNAGNNNREFEFPSTENEPSNMLTKTSELDDICTTEEERETTDKIVFRKPATFEEKTEPKMLQKTPVAITRPLNATTVKLPINAGGKLKQIFISPRELSKITRLRSENFLRKANEANLVKNTLGAGVPIRKVSPDIKYVSQMVKPIINNIANPPININTTIPPQSVKIGLKSSEDNSTQGRNEKSEEFENESIISEAIGEDDGLKDNLLATVIDFQEQNNQEFIEIKNLMKQNNLLQRETNRLLRLILEKQ